LLTRAEAARHVLSCSVYAQQAEIAAGLVTTVSPERRRPAARARAGHASLPKSLSASRKTNTRMLPARGRTTRVVRCAVRTPRSATVAVSSSTPQYMSAKTSFSYSARRSSFKRIKVTSEKGRFYRRNSAGNCSITAQATVVYVDTRGEQQNSPRSSPRGEARDGNRCAS